MRRLLLPFLLLFVVISCLAQTSGTAVVPPLVKFSGTLANTQGTVGVIFALYTEQTGGAPLWLETQNVTPDADGRYTAYLGVNHANGVPLDIFASAEARWLGVQPEGQAEQPRVQLVSVPYALKAADATTLGGQPLSAFVLASNAGTTTGTGSSAATANAGSGVLALASPQDGSSPVYTSGSASANYMAKFSTATDVEPSTVIYDSGSAVGIGTANPLAILHVVSQVPPAQIVDVYSGGSTTSLGALPLVTRAARGTLLVPPLGVGPFAVKQNDYLGGLGARAYTGTKFTNGWRAAVLLRADQDWSDTAQGTNIAFGVTAPNTTAQAQVMTLTSGGALGIGTTTPSALLEVNGTAKFDDLVTFASGQTFPGAGVSITSPGGSITVGGTASAPYLDLNANLASAIAGAVPMSALGAPNGVASLDGTGHVLPSVLPSMSSGQLSDSANLAYTNQGNVFTSTATQTFNNPSSFGSDIFATTFGMAANTVTNFRVSPSGGVILPASGTATTMNGVFSSYLQWNASVYRSFDSTAHTAQLGWQALPTGNNTSSPSGQLNFVAGLDSLNPTGLFINADGTINFASNQVFPGTSITTAMGSPLFGNGTSGNPLSIQQASSYQNGYLNSIDWMTFNNKLSSLNTTMPLGGNGSSGSPLTLSGIVPVSNGGTGYSFVGTSGSFLRSNGTSLMYSPISSSDLPTGVYVDLVSPQMIAGNKNFTSQATFNVGTNSSNALQAEADGVGAVSIQGQTNAFDVNAAGVSGNAMFSGTSSAKGVLGVANGNNGIGVSGNAYASCTGGGSGCNPIGVFGSTNNGSGAGGLFNSNASGGDILRATYNNSAILKVGTNSSGRPYANLAPYGTPTTGTNGGVASSMLNFTAAVLDNTTGCSGGPCISNPKFGWRADPINNNAAGYGAQLAFYSGLGSANSTATGLSINSNGIITFAANQPFPGSNGTITGVTTGFGSGLSGGGTVGTLNLSLLSSCTTGQLLKWNGGAWACADDLVDTGGVTGSGYLPLSGGVMTGSVNGTMASFTAATTASGDNPPAPTPSPVVAVTQTGDGPPIPQTKGSLGLAFMQSIPAAIYGNATTGTGLAAGVVGNSAGGVGVVALSESQGAPAMIAYNMSTSAGSGLIAWNNNTNDSTLQAENYATGGSQNNGPTALSAAIHSQYGTALNIQSDYNSASVNLISTSIVSGDNSNSAGFSVDGTGAVTANSLNVSGAAQVNSLTVNGTVSFNSLTLNGLTVTNGTGQFNNGINVSNQATLQDLTVSNNAQFNNGISGPIGSTLQVNNGLNVNNQATLQNLQVNGTAQVSTLSGTGTSSVQISNGLNVNSGQTNVQNITVNGSMNGPNTGGTNTLQINGNLNVSGSVNKSGGNFKIDHPLDPANKILYHSFVESPDMMNIYNGIVVLDKRGQAWVKMPEWFDALNRDCRYQLTAVGAPGPNLYIAQELSGNRFKIAGGKAGMKVSWQVTGIRQDAWANAHRTQVEENKTPAERGTYLHPELFPEKTALAHK